MTAAATRGIATFPSQNVANLIWAYASLGRDLGPSLAAAVQHRMATILEDFTPKVHFELYCSDRPRLHEHFQSGRLIL